jgi:hypothetical protein
MATSHVQELIARARIAHAARLAATSSQSAPGEARRPQAVFTQAVVALPAAQVPQTNLITQIVTAAGQQNTQTAQTCS